MAACLHVLLSAVLGALGLAGLWARSHFGAGAPVVDTHDCYFDKECHELVDWNMVTKMKMGFFKRLKHMKEKGDVKNVKPMTQHMHQGFLKAGMPEDRIDYILTKWVQYAYPEALAVSDTSQTIEVSGFYCENGYGKDLNGDYVYQGTTKDGRAYYKGLTRPDRFLYYDKYCADDTRKPRWLLGGAPDVAREFDLNPDDGKGCDNDFAIQTDSMHLPGGLQQATWQWCGDHGHHASKSVSITYKANGQASKKSVDTKDCYFDKECHAKVDWDKIHRMKRGFFFHAKLLKKPVGEKDLKPMLDRMHQGFLQAGMPEDRIDYILTKWVKLVLSEGSGKQPDEKKDGCYMRFGNDKEKCEATRGRCHWYADKSGRSGKCAMPEKKDECKEYEKWGENAVHGCRGCAKGYPGHVKECFACAKTCSEICLVGSDFECYKGEKFQSCHRPCMKKATEKPIDTKDCYFDKECHAKVDWDKVAKMKEGFSARLKWMKKSGDLKIMKPLMERMHKGFLKAGMPEDRIDYILEKWVKFVFPEALSNQPKDECKFAEKDGPDAVQGCKSCAKYYPGRVKECWNCGGKCSNICPAGSTKECYEGKPFVSCHSSCMKESFEKAMEHAFEKDWKKLTPEERNAAELCGYAQDSWDNDGKVPIDLLWWSEVPDRQRQALMTLGYTEDTWNKEDGILV